MNPSSAGGVRGMDLLRRRPLALARSAFQARCGGDGSGWRLLGFAKIRETERVGDEEKQRLMVEEVREARRAKTPNPIFSLCGRRRVESTF
ncbi:hypothetical protein Syun_015113 [Stephania yunnanensis]|uniref:Uncharacterized protein n=1 Tax=Stephania yunnanensis TaxID=152371 RepID=A0AAP0JMA9_9MAGN